MRRNASDLSLLTPSPPRQSMQLQLATGTRKDSLGWGKTMHDLSHALVEATGKAIATLAVELERRSGFSAKEFADILAIMAQAEPDHKVAVGAYLTGWANDVARLGSVCETAAE